MLLAGERSARRDMAGDDGVLLSPITHVLYHRFEPAQLTTADKMVMPERL
jgi:hypothetical protein